MNRRNFVYLSGTALAGLLFVKKSHAAADPHEMLQLPEEVFLRLDDGIHRMTASRDGVWTYKNVQVVLVYADDALAVKVQSPEDPLHEVLLQWTYPTGADSTLLGDQWERTYGDVCFQHPSFDRKMPWYLYSMTAS